MNYHPPSVFLTSSALLILVVILTACASTREQEPSAINEPNQPGETQKLQVVATTTIVADVVSQIGGDAIILTVLLPVGTDPHTFVPTPKDVARVADAEVVFANGAGLEEFLAPLIESAGAEGKVVLLSEGIELLTPEGKQSHQQEPEGEEQKHKDESGDPHTWTDPNNVIVWVHNIEHKLTDLDPFNTEIYETNAKQYEGELRDLDAWIGGKVAQIPPDSRKIVTDHLILAYFVEEYGFTQIGTIIPGYSTIAEPSAQELAKLEDTVREFDVNAIFVGNTVNPSLAERVAEDTGTQLVFIFTGSLTEKGGEADNYLNYIRYNVYAIVNNLK